MMRRRTSFRAGWAALLAPLAPVLARLPASPTAGGAIQSYLGSPANGATVRVINASSGPLTGWIGPLTTGVLTFTDAYPEVRALTISNGPVAHLAGGIHRPLAVLDEMMR